MWLWWCIHVRQHMMCDMTHYTCDMTHSYMWHDSFIRVYVIYMWLYVCHIYVNLCMLHIFDSMYVIHICDSVYVIHMWLYVCHIYMTPKSFQLTPNPSLNKTPIHKYLPIHKTQRPKHPSKHKTPIYSRTHWEVASLCAILYIWHNMLSRIYNIAPKYIGLFMCNI